MTDRNGDHDDPVLTAMPPGRGKRRLRAGIDVDDLEHTAVCEALTPWQGLRIDRFDDGAAALVSGARSRHRGGPEASVECRPTH